MIMDNPFDKVLYCSIWFAVAPCLKDDFPGDSSGSDINAQHKLPHNHA